MRHSLIAVCGDRGALRSWHSPAKAAPLSKIDGVNSQSGTVETVRYWRRRWGYRPYRYGGAPITGTAIGVSRDFGAGGVRPAFSLTLQN